jgi:hypothetical protein
LVPALREIWVAVPDVPVAVNVTGLPPSPPEVAVKVFVPAVVPNTHEFSAAIPDEFVTTEAPVGDEIEPPPAVTANTTVTPATGFVPSVTSTDGAVATAAPATAVWPLPAFAAMVVAALAFPVAVNVTGLPVKPAAAAVTEFDPAEPPRRHAARAAIPDPLVLTVNGPATRPPPLLIWPAPEATVKVTVTPTTGLPAPSFTTTDGGVVTDVETVALCPVPPLSAICVAVPDASVTVDETVVRPELAKAIVSEPADPLIERPANVATPLAFV